MTENKSRISMTQYVFAILLAAGAILLLYSFFNGHEDRIFGGLRQMGLGITLTGVGEWINHPLQKSMTYREKREFIFHRVRHRKRNPSALGNLLVVCGLLLIFTGLADYF